MHAAKRIKTFSYWTLLDAWLGVYAGRPRVRRGVGDKARGPGRGNRRDDTPRVALIARVRRALSTQSHHQNSHDKPKKQMKATDTFDPTSRRRDPGAKATGVPRARRQVQAHALAVLWRGAAGAARSGGRSWRRLHVAVTVRDPHAQTVKMANCACLLPRSETKKVISLDVIKYIL